MSSREELKAGTILADRFEIVGEIGRGGMGVVYEAVHVTTRRRLAVKVLLESYANKREIVVRFEREARAATAIGDPHVIDVVDVGRLPSGAPFIVLEYLEGRELSKTIRGDFGLPQGRVAHIVMQLAAAMGKAHARGIVHRDLKPSNVFLIERDGDPDYVKVLDFGIAKLDEAEDQTEASEPLTKTGQMVGTPLYMSREQLMASRDVDARSDVYAIGVIAYEMLTCRVPYEAHAAPELLLKIMTTQPVSLSFRRPDLSPEYIAAVERAMARDAQDRFQNGSDLAAAFAPFAASWDPQSPLEENHAELGLIASSSDGVSPSMQFARTSAAMTASVRPESRNTRRTALSATIALAIVLSGTWAVVRGLTPRTPEHAIDVPPHRAVVPTQDVVRRTVEQAEIIPAPLSAIDPPRTVVTVLPAPSHDAGTDNHGANLRRIHRRSTVDEAPHIEANQ